MDAAEGLCTGTPRQDFRFLRTGRAGTGGSLPLVQVQAKVQERTWRDGGESEVSGAAGETRSTSLLVTQGCVHTLDVCCHFPRQTGLGQGRGYSGPRTQERGPSRDQSWNLSRA